MQIIHSHIFLYCFLYSIEYFQNPFFYLKYFNFFQEIKNAPGDGSLAGFRKRTENRPLFFFFIRIVGRRRGPF